jgi:glycosyltransferase involved in cell wall biosynthesis
MKRINWQTGGKVSTNWAYGINCMNLTSKLTNYSHEIDLDIDVCDIVVFYDILLMKKQLVNFHKAKKILRLGGPQPFEILKSKNTDINELVKRADAIVSVSQYLTSFLDHPNISVIPNSVNFKYFNPDGYKPPNEFTIGFVGNVSNQTQRHLKGYDYVEVAAKKLNIPFKKALRDRFEIPNKEMAKKFYNHISCLVLPSVSKEGCSNAVGEALASGVPVIICDETPSYHTENMTDRHDILFCKRDVDDICYCIEELHNPLTWTRLSENGLEFVKEHQNLDIIAKQWEEVFKKL